MDFLVIAALCVSLLACVVCGFPILAALAVGLVLAVLYGIWKGRSVGELALMACRGVKSARNVLFNFLLIGMLCALWRASGTVPSVICYASALIQPATFLLVTFALNALVSAITGTAFGTAAVAGVVCATMGQAAGVPIELVGGAVLSGAYFGDRCSPVSTSALLIADLTGTTVSENIAGMLKTALVPFVACALAYLALGAMLSAGPATPDLFSLFGSELSIHPITLLPVAAVLLACVFKARIAVSLGSGIAVAALLCVVFQNESAIDVARIAMFGFVPRDAQLAAVLSGGGIVSMANVAAIVCLSSAYAGIFQETGVFDRLTNGVEALGRRATFFGATLVVSAAAAAISCNQTLTIMFSHQLTGKIAETDRQRALDLENTAVLLPALVPWSIACSVPLTAIGAPVASVAAAFFLFLVPLWQLLCAFARRFRARYDAASGAGSGALSRAGAPERCFAPGAQQRCMIPETRSMGSSQLPRIHSSITARSPFR